MRDKGREREAGTETQRNTWKKLKRKFKNTQTRKVTYTKLRRQNGLKRKRRKNEEQGGIGQIICL